MVSDTIAHNREIYYTEPVWLDVSLATQRIKILCLHISNYCLALEMNKNASSIAVVPTHVGFAEESYYIEDRR